MDSPDPGEKALKLVNLARAAYGAPELESLPGGQIRNALYCPVGRSLRKGVEDWLFVTVGSKHLRLWAVGRDPVIIAKQIMTAWGMSHEQPKPSRARPEIIMVPLPPELREFLLRFDRGLLPNLQGQIDQQEVQDLKELASSMPNPVGPRSKTLLAGEG